MAKCIQLVGQGLPVRCTDDEAFQIVERDKDGQYCSKHFWRDNYLSPVLAEQTPRRSEALKALMAASS